MRPMIKDYLPYEEHKALEQICAHHGVTDPELVKDLAAFGNWLIENERDKARLSRVPQAPFLLAFLSMRGIYKRKESA